MGHTTYRHVSLIDLHQSVYIGKFFVDRWMYVKMDGQILRPALLSRLSGVEQHQLM